MGKNSKNNQTVAAQPVQSTKAVTHSEPKESQRQSGDTSLEVFLWLLAFSVLMFTLPFLGFYGVRSWLQESFTTLSTFEVNCYSVLTAVLVVNAIVAMYVVKAMREKVTPAPSIEEDENKKEQ
ncbi:uncharacterized protein LOC108604031 [Drosophila busckii]|uniref:uncharacterized protein LOC108604031 n=1 Tax=Drosophila busckii TaxID=30019 RepID=UPI00083F0E72|nr:uncharacterized protein LOC108604031 [Drosophila busckii]